MTQQDHHRSTNKNSAQGGGINWGKVRRRWKKRCRKFFQAVGKGVVTLGQGAKDAAVKSVPFWKRLGVILSALGKKIGQGIGHLFGKLDAKLQGTKVYPVYAAIGRFFGAIGRGFKSLGKPVQKVITAASLVAVVALILVAAISGQAKKAAQLETEEQQRMAEASAQAALVEAETFAPVDTPIPEETPAPTDTAETTPAPFGQSYKKGDDGEIIADVQLRLMELGYMDSDEPTEHFGSMTEEALISFQKHNGLTTDGVLREATYEALFSGDAKEYVMQNGDEGDSVEAVQQRLYELGYLGKSSVTGTFGDKTTEAVKDFQSSNGLKADGKAGEKTLEKLYDTDVVGNFFRKGDTNEDIKQYQQKLMKLGYLSSDYNAKGKMDNDTVSALKTFQEVNGIIADGCLGVVTMELLDSGKAEAYTLKLGMRSSDIKDIQRRLYKLGYLEHSSQITGYYGAETEEAVEAFQKRNGLTADGTVGPKTLKVLESDDAKKPRATATPKPTKKPSKTSKPTATPKPGKTNKPGTTTKATATPKTTKKPSNSSSSKIDNFIEIAKSKLGCKYVSGAKGPNQFDCSGFVYWCLNQAGVKQSYMTSRTWRTCTKYTRYTDMSEAKKGDVLVFSGSTMSGKGHVGIYLGNGKMIDASSGAGQVRITSSSILTSKYWKQHWLMGYHIWD